MSDPALDPFGGASPRVREALEDLAIDAINTMRAMLDHGDTDQRIAVIRQLLPQIEKMLVRNPTEDDGTGTDPAAEARRMLDEMWAPFGAKDKAS